MLFWKDLRLPMLPELIMMSCSTLLSLVCQFACMMFYCMYIFLIYFIFNFFGEYFTLAIRCSFLVLWYIGIHQLSFDFSHMWEEAYTVFSILYNLHCSTFSRCFYPKRLITEFYSFFFFSFYLYHNFKLDKNLMYTTIYAYWPCYYLKGRAKMQRQCVCKKRKENRIE